MGLFKSESSDERRLNALCSSLGEAAAKVVRGDMPADFFDSACNFNEAEIKRLHASIAHNRGRERVTTEALKAADISASAWGKYGGKKAEANAREIVSARLTAILTE